MSKRTGKRRKHSAPAAQSSKRKQFDELVLRILDSLKQRQGFQGAEELIAELRGWAGSYLAGLLRQIEEGAPGERLVLLDLISHLEDPDAVPYLEQLIFEAPVDVAAKQRAAEILEELGNPLEVGMAESLRNAAAVLNGIPTLKPESFHGSHPLFVKFVRLPTTLREATLIELSSTAPQTALDFIELIRSRENRPPVETIEALVLLDDPRAARILEDYLDAAPDKETARVVRRALYRLSSRGIEIKEEGPQPKAGGQGIFRRVVVPPQGYKSVVDGSGSRVVWVAKPVAGGGRLLFQAIVNDEQGLLDFSAMEVSLRSFRSYIAEVTGQGREFPVCEVPPAYAAFLMDEAYRRTQAEKGGVPQEYPVNQRQIAELAGTERPQLNLPRLKPEEEISPADMKALLDQPEFAGWQIGEEEVSPIVDEVKSSFDSRLVVSRGMRHTQIEEIIQKAAQSLFTKDRLERFAKRLEDTAYVLQRLGRGEMVQSTLALAESLRRADGEAAKHPFLDEMLRRSVMQQFTEQLPPETKEKLSAAQSDEPTGGKEPSLIITPGEYRQSLPNV